MITVGKRKQWEEDWENAVFPPGERPRYSDPRSGSSPTEPQTPYEEKLEVIGLDGKPLAAKA